MRTPIRCLAALLVFGGVVYAQLTRVNFPDGTGSIGLAAGFQLTEAYRGSVSASNGRDAGIALGIPFTMMPPDSSLMSLPAAQQRPIAYPNDIKTALSQVLQKVFQSKLISARATAAPQAIAGIPAYYVMYEYQAGKERYVNIAYITSLIYGGQGEMWQLYVSAISASKATFMKRYPVLMSMWRSWKPNGQQPVAGSQSAQLDQILKDRQQRFEQMQEAFRQAL